MPTTGVLAPSVAFQPTSGASGSWTWMTSNSPRADGAARCEDAAGREGREVGDGAVGAEADGAPQRRQVVGQLTLFGGGPVQHPTDPAGRIEGGEHADVVATAEELLGESFDVPVHAPLVGPGIWRDETYAHEH